jgi:hypothetical protein
VDLVLRIEKRIKEFEHSGIGNRTVVTLLREAAEAISFLRKQNRTLATGGAIPGVVTRDAIVDDD